MRILLAILVVAAAAAEEALVVGSEGVTRRAETPSDFTGTVRFVADGPAGLAATFIARSLRRVMQDDWRTTQTVAGVRRDSHIDQPRGAFGSEDERRAFGIRGRAGDWDNFSVQWDGVIAIPPEGAELATRSDDGSRVWLDLDRDGRAGAGEWGANGWGSGQGATLRTVHAAVPGGTWPIRVQYEEGGGGNICVLQWRSPPGVGAWTTVPAEAFSRTPVLRLDGPFTVRAAFDGTGELHAGNGVRLATAPATGVTVIAGSVALTADLELGALSFTRSGTLALDGRTLRLGSAHGGGRINLAGGLLQLGQGSGLQVAGPGTLATSAPLTLAELAPEVQVRLDEAGAAVRAPGRCLARTTLAAPLSTVIDLGMVDDQAATGLRLDLDLDGPLAGAGLMVWRADRHGRWFQQAIGGRLVDGAQRLTIALDGASQLVPVGHGDAWSASAAIECRRLGLLIYHDRTLTGTVAVDARWSAAAASPAAPRLTDLVPLPRRVVTGQRVELHVRPDPFPAWPLDPTTFSLALEVAEPGGRITSYNGFADQPYRRHDRGDREDLVADGPPRFTVRWRARQPGTHSLTLRATWDDGRRQLRLPLPEVTAAGPPWDDIVRVDPVDPRFLASQGAFVWPIGHNLNSTYDTRSRQALATRLTPDRGSFVREAMLGRLAAAGGTGSEVWLSPWNLGLEWIDDWRGFHGAGRLNLGNAWAVDRLLGQAEREGLRIVVSIFNHGMGRAGSGPEEDWRHHPWNDANGGWLSHPRELFTDARALRHQENLFRYLAARWGDSPAVMVWKLWAEVNLVHASVDLLRPWHEAAAALLAQHDPWNHLITTHWCGDWRVPDPIIAAQPGLGMLTIDAYHGEGTLISDLLAQSTSDPRRPGDGLAIHGKPVLVTEYGGSPMAAPEARLLANYAIGGWAALTHGHAGAPMLWWFEWIDQGGRYAPITALRRFTDGEDLRHAEAKTVAPELRIGDRRLWCRAWQRPGRMLGYILDPAWAGVGGDGQLLEGGMLDLGIIGAGAMGLEWWDADTGERTAIARIDHQGGRLRQPIPSFSRHCAFKLWRVVDAEVGLVDPEQHRGVAAALPLVRP